MAAGGAEQNGQDTGEIDFGGCVSCWSGPISRMKGFYAMPLPGISDCMDTSSASVETHTGGPEAFYCGGLDGSTPTDSLHICIMYSKNHTNST